MSPKSGSNSAFTRFLMKLLICWREGVTPFSLRSDATPFHLSIRWSGSLFTILRRLSVALTSARWLICFNVATQFTTSKENSCNACLSSPWSFRFSTSLFMYALAMTLGWPNCSFNVFSAVAYIVPCEPRPLIARSAFPIKCIFSCTILKSSDRWGRSWMCSLKRSINST